MLTTAVVIAAGIRNAGLSERVQSLYSLGVACLEETLIVSNVTVLPQIFIKSKFLHNVLFLYQRKSRNISIRAIDLKQIYLRGKII